MEEEKKQVIIVRGNSKDIAIPLQKETVVADAVVSEDYIPVEGADIIVSLKNEYVSYDYTPILIDGNVLTIHDDGNLPSSTYNVEIRITNPDGTKLRSMWCCVVRVCECNDPLLKEYDDFREGGETLIASMFYFAKGEKGDKGDPLTYEDLTPEQIEELQKPALDAKEDCEEWLEAHAEQIITDIHDL